MKVSEAIQECQRWLAKTEADRVRTLAVQKLAKQVRDGTIEPEEGHRRLRALYSKPVVYDGTKLAEAVSVLIEVAESSH